MHGIPSLSNRRSTPFPTAPPLHFPDCYVIPIHVSHQRTRIKVPPPIRPHRTPAYIPTIPRYIDACLSRHPLLVHLLDAPPFVGLSALEILYFIRYLFLERDAQREKLLPKLSGQRREVMKGILDRYKRTVKRNIKLRREC